MKEFIEVPQFETLQAEDPVVLTQRVNCAVMEHRNESPQVTWADEFTARISFIKKVRIFEEEKEAAAKFTCGECPLYTPQKKKNGDEDARSKHGDCIFAPYGRTGRDTPACGKLYDLLKEGMIRLSLSEEAEEGVRL